MDSEELKNLKEGDFFFRKDFLRQGNATSKSSIKHLEYQDEKGL